jgi:cytochrome b pre-mRNA-processing protein 3
MTRLYGAIVAQARSEAFYRDYGVPDSVNGRFEMVVLHLLLALRRLGPGDVRGPAQLLFDLFCSDMDGNLREIGVGDLAVPREMRRMGEAFYGRRAAYEAALNAADRDALAAALARNVFGSAAAPGDPAWAGAKKLASYVMAAEHALAAQDLGDGHVEFPDPAAVTASAPVAERTG